MHSVIFDAFGLVLFHAQTCDLVPFSYDEIKYTNQVEIHDPLR